MLAQIREKSLIEVQKKIEKKKNSFKKEEEEFEKKIREIKLKRQYLQQGKVKFILFIIRLLSKKKHISK